MEANGLTWGDREMRKQGLGLIVPLLALALIATAADVTVPGTPSSLLQRLEVAHGRDGLRVEFKAKGPLAPKVTTLDSPRRIVVDFPNTIMATGQNSLPVGQDGVKDISIGMDAQHNTRVVLDMAGSSQHELVAGADGAYTLKISAPGVASNSASNSAPNSATRKSTPPRLRPRPALLQPASLLTSLSSSPNFRRSPRNPLPKLKRLPAALLTRPRRNSWPLLRMRPCRAARRFNLPSILPPSRRNSSHRSRPQTARNIRASRSQSTLKMWT